MNVIWHKVWHDLWRNKPRTLLAVLSIAAGVFAVGAIFGMVDQLLAGMDDAHRAVAPSHVNVILRDYISDEQAQELADIEGVVAVEPVNLLSVRYKTQPDEEWRLGSLVMRQDYEAQIFDLVILREGEWPAGGAVALERLSAQYFDLAIGDEVIFEINGDERAMPVNGLIRHPFVEPPPFGGQAHFFTDAAGLADFGVPEGFFGQLLIQVEPYSRELAQEAAGEIRSRLANQGVGVLVTLYQEPERHWGRMFVEGVTLVLQIMAVVSLVLSVALVVNTLTAVITQQTNQIGILKAIGGRRWIIIQLYLAVVLVYGLLALLIALPLGAVTAYESSRWFLNLFNIDYELFQFSSRALLYQFIAALFVPLAAALWPVLLGASITVREAIATYGLGADFGSNFLDRGIERIGQSILPTLYAASLGNLFRRKGRLALTLLVLTVAGVMFLTVASLASSTQLTLDNDMARRGYDLHIGFNADQPAADLLALAGEAENVAQAEVWFTTQATILRAGERLQDSAGLGAQLTAIPIGSDMQRPLIVEGRWLEAGDEQVVVISQDTALNNEIGVGDPLTLDLGLLGSHEWRVAGVFKTVYNGGFVTEPIYAPYDAVSDLLNIDERGTMLYVQTAASDRESVAAVADALKNVYEAEGMGVNLFTTALKAEQRENVDNQFAPVVSMLMGLASLMAVVGAIGLMGAMGISVIERRREIGVLRAIGARSPHIVTMFVAEGVFQGLISWLISAPLAYLLARPLAQLLGRTMVEIDLDYAFNAPALFYWLVVILFISALASILPARDAVRVTVRESLAYAG